MGVYNANAGAGQTGAQKYIIEYAYALSKRTSLNANMLFLKNSSGGRFAWYGDGALGQRQNIFTAGITHAF